MNDTYRTARLYLLFLLTVIAVALVGRVAVAIYDEAHPRSIDVWCNDIPNNGAWERSYTGPADQVLNACEEVHR